MAGGARAVGLLAAALVGFGLAFDLPTLYEPGVALGLLTGGAYAWVRLASRGARFRRVRPAPTVTEGDPLELRFAFERGRVRPPGLELRDPLLDGEARAVSLPDGELGFVASWQRRGRKELGPTSLLIRDPLGLCAQPIEADGAVSVLVLPRIESIRVGGEGGGGGLGALGLLAEGAEARRGAAAVEIEIDGLRPYQRGSPASRIHWPTVARTQEMVERRLESGAGARPLVVLDSSTESGDEALDKAVRAAASLAHHLALTGGCGLAISGEARVLEIDSRLRGWPEAHSRLAKVSGRERAPMLRGGRSRGAVVFWVTAGGSAAPRGVGAAESFLVSPRPAAAEAGELFIVAGCSGRRVRERAGVTPTAMEPAA